MGGFTTISLIDKSESNIAKHNKLLEEFGVRKSIRFATLHDQLKEYEFFRQCRYDNTLNNYYSWVSWHVSNDVSSLNDFIRLVWNSNKLVWIDDIGRLSLDCYFGRTSKRAMRNLGRYLAEHHDAIDKVTGSIETFIERGMTKRERQIIKESKLSSQIIW